MNTNVPFVGNTAVCGVPGTGWEWNVTVSVPSAVSTQTFSVLVNGAVQATLTGDQIYGPIGLAGIELLTVTGTTVYTGQAVLVSGDVRYVGVGEANPPPNSYNILDYGADPTGANDSTAAIQAADAAAAVDGGVIYAPPGTFIAEGLVPSSNTRWVGAGTGATILKLKAAATSPLIAQVVSAGGTFHDWSIEDMTLDGNGTTTQYTLAIDTSANSNITYYNLTAIGCTFQNGYVGAFHAGNNSSSGPTTNGMKWQRCRFSANQYGLAFGGTYGEEVSHCYFARNTLWNLCTLSAWEVPLTGGSGPTACPIIDDVRVEGIGNFSGSGTDNGISIGASAGIASDLYISNVSNYAFTWASSEGFASVLSNINGWGNGSGIHLTGVSSTDAGSLTNFAWNQGGQNTNLSSALRSPLSIGQGGWVVSKGTITNGTNVPAYGISLGYDGGGSTVNQAIFEDVSFPSFGTSLYQLNSTPLGGLFALRNCQGVNPTGAQTAPAIPASGTALTNPFPFDCTVAITGTCTVTVGGIEVASISGGPSPVFLAAGQTITLTYTTAPTWAWTGH